MAIGRDDSTALTILDSRLKALLPEEYQESYEDLQPVSMGSAGLKFGDDGKVAWDEIWATFCDLAMAGGPPHKGTLLEPAPQPALDAQSERYAQVAAEICRGIRMATDLDAQPSPVPGWVRVTCLSEVMAGWLLRAIVMENVAARGDGEMLDLPAASHFRLEKEIKNVVTVIAKTVHYWTGHMPRSQKWDITNLFAQLADDCPLIEPALPRDDVRAAAHKAAASAMGERIHRETGLRAWSDMYSGWLGVECPSVRAAVWMMRAIVAGNILSRREGTVLFVPVNPQSDPAGDGVVKAVATVHRLAGARGVL